jgi:hypothetical protein
MPQSSEDGPGQVGDPRQRSWYKYDENSLVEAQWQELKVGKATEKGVLVLYLSYRLTWRGRFLTGRVAGCLFCPHLLRKICCHPMHTPFNSCLSNCVGKSRQLKHGSEWDVLRSRMGCAFCERTVSSPGLLAASS